MIDLKLQIPVMDTKDKHNFVIKSTNKRWKVQDKIRDLLNKHQIKGVGKEIERAIGNGFRHGSLPISCEILFDKDMCLVNIKDSGRGFNFNNIVARFQSGKRYYHNHGSGTKKFARNPHVKVNWVENGTRIYLLYKK
jgi:hypothetical protein